MPKRLNLAAMNVGRLSALCVTLALLVACKKSVTESAPPSAESAPADLPTLAPQSNENANGNLEPAKEGPNADSRGTEAASPPNEASPAPSSSAESDASTPTAGEKPDAPNCGRKPLPECPLQAWMKQNATPPMTAKNLPAVAEAFDAMVPFDPGEGYENWKSISRDGASAARAGNMGAVKAACRGCHEQYKNKYRREMRARPLPR